MVRGVKAQEQRVPEASVRGAVRLQQPEVGPQEQQTVKALVMARAAVKSRACWEARARVR